MFWLVAYCLCLLVAYVLVFGGMVIANDTAMTIGGGVGIVGMVCVVVWLQKRRR